MISSFDLPVKVVVGGAVQRGSMASELELAPLERAGAEGCRRRRDSRAAPVATDLRGRRLGRGRHGAAGRLRRRVRAARGPGAVPHRTRARGRRHGRLAQRCRSRSGRALRGGHQRTGGAAAGVDTCVLRAAAIAATPPRETEPGACFGISPGTPRNRAQGAGSPSARPIAEAALGGGITCREWLPSVSNCSEYSLVRQSRVRGRRRSARRCRPRRQSKVIRRRNVGPVLGPVVHIRLWRAKIAPRGKLGRRLRNDSDRSWLRYP